MCAQARVARLHTCAWACLLACQNGYFVKLSVAHVGAQARRRQGRTHLCARTLARIQCVPDHARIKAFVNIRNESWVRRWRNRVGTIEEALESGTSWKEDRQLRTIFAVGSSCWVVTLVGARLRRCSTITSWRAPNNSSLQRRAFHATPIPSRFGDAFAVHQVHHLLCKPISAWRAMVTVALSAISACAGARLISIERWRTSITWS